MLQFFIDPAKLLPLQRFLVKPQRGAGGEQNYVTLVTFKVVVTVDLLCHCYFQCYIVYK